VSLLHAVNHLQRDYQPNDSAHSALLGMGC
jgi:hypothetical protein